MASMSDTMSATSYDPTSVLGTYNAITNTDSPLMQQAAASANRQAARSGLQNSSMAVGAAQGAQATAANTLATNAATLAEQQRSAQSQEGLSQQQITNQNSQFGQSLAQQQAESAQQNAQFNQSQAQQASQYATSILANTKGSYTDAVNNLLNNSSVNINNISSNANLDQAAKDKLIAQELSNRNNDLTYLQTLYGGVQSWAEGL